MYFVVIFLCPANEFQLKTTRCSVRLSRPWSIPWHNFVKCAFVFSWLKIRSFWASFLILEGGSHVGKGWVCSMFFHWYYFSMKISLCAGGWSWCNSQQHRLSVYSAQSLTIYRTFHSTRLQWILSVSNVWMHYILIWVLYNFSLYTGWFRMKGEYFGRWQYQSL